MENQKERLKRFEGSWSTEGIIPANGINDEIKIIGTDTYEWILNEQFLLHRADVIIGHEKSETHEVIGFDALNNQYTMHYFNNKGEQGLMQAEVVDGTWNFRSEQLRFSGSFNTDGDSFSGNWEQFNSQQKWVNLMQIKLTKKKSH